MENKNIIIILVAIIVVLAVVAGVMFLQSGNTKESTKVKITSDKTQYEGGKLSIQLTDLNKTALSKEKVNITITNKKGKVVVNETVKTNSKGKAKLDLDLKKGKYTVNVTYAGNENYTGNSTTQNLTIKEEVKETASESSSSVIQQNLFMMGTQYLIKMVKEEYTVQLVNSLLIQPKTHHIKHFKKQMQLHCTYSLFRIIYYHVYIHFLYQSCLLACMLEILTTFTN